MKPDEFFRNEGHFQKWAVRELRCQGHHVQEITGDDRYPGIPDLSIGMPEQEVWAEVKLWRVENDIYDTLATAMSRGRPVTAQQLKWLRERGEKGCSVCGILIGWRTKYFTHYVSFIPIGEWDTRLGQPLAVLALSKRSDTLNSLVDGRAKLSHLFITEGEQDASRCF